MMIRKYTPAEYMWLREWLEHRGIQSWEESGLPKIGFIAYDDAGFTAIAFLRLIEGERGMIDALCSNPGASPARRDKGIDCVVVQILIEARAMGLKGILSFSKDENTLARAERIGFKKLDDTLIVKTLED